MVLEARGMATCSAERQHNGRNCARSSPGFFQDFPIEIYQPRNLMILMGIFGISYIFPIYFQYISNIFSMTLANPRLCALRSDNREVFKWGIHIHANRSAESTEMPRSTPGQQFLGKHGSGTPSTNQQIWYLCIFGGWTMRNSMFQLFHAHTHTLSLTHILLFDYAKLCLALLNSVSLCWTMLQDIPNGSCFDSSLIRQAPLRSKSLSLQSVLFAREAAFRGVHGPLFFQDPNWELPCQQMTDQPRMQHSFEISPRDNASKTSISAEFPVKTCSSFPAARFFTCGYPTLKHNLDSFRGNFRMPWSRKDWGSKHHICPFHFLMPLVALIKALALEFLGISQLCWSTGGYERLLTIQSYNC